MKIVFFSNSSWSIYNFRRDLIKKLILNGNEVYILSSKDKSTTKLRNIGCKIVEIKILNNSINVFKDISLLLDIKKSLFAEYSFISSANTTSQFGQKYISS